MQSIEQEILKASSRINTLFVGDMSKACAKPEEFDEAGYRRCKTMLDAISLATSEIFTTIYVIIAGFDNRLESALMTLRRVTPDSRIILLAQMHEEARARKMIRSLKDITRPCDDYLICPVDIHTLSPTTIEPPKPTGPVPAGVSSLFAYKDARIAELEKLATEDDLTHLKNRRYVREFTRQIIGRARNDNFRVTLLVFDIDNFKHYNDKYGHAVGDNVLRQTATMMRRCCRSHDVTGRIGGDEFAFIFWDRPGDKEAKASVKMSDAAESERRSTEGDHPNEAVFMAERFRKEISSAELSFLGSEGKGVLTVSGGLASFPQDGETVEELFEKADKALLEAKRSGKNQIYLVGQ